MFFSRFPNLSPLLISSRFQRHLLSCKLNLRSMNINLLPTKLVWILNLNLWTKLLLLKSVMLDPKQIALNKHLFFPQTDTIKSFQKKSIRNRDKSRKDIYYTKVSFISKLFMNYNKKRIPERPEDLLKIYLSSIVD